jgi:hypothetical protein
MNWDYLIELFRKFCVVVATFCAAFFYNTTGFLIALLLTFGMHIVAGMGADKVKLKWRWGVPPAYLKNFEVPKITVALLDLFIIVSLTYLLKGIVDLNNYVSGSPYMVQLFFAIASYGYFLKGIDNLIKRYPKHAFLRIIRALITLKFKDLVGEDTHKIIEKEMQTDIKKQNNNEQAN